jgi:hypothetical protein
LIRKILDSLAVVVGATAKLPLTVPVIDIEQVGAGLVAKKIALLLDDRIQLRELPVGNPDPETMTFPSNVPNPGVVTFGDTKTNGPFTLKNWVAAL